MRKQRNMFQVKEQDKTSEINLNEVPVSLSNLPDKEFRVMLIKKLTNLGKRMAECRMSTKIYKIQESTKQ